ncbi:MAG: nodulation protein NfeD [Cyclobacteriaceae bacterium]|nr:nodulation protein NfeD [Cyclobacteriaceae bacterium]
MRNCFFILVALFCTSAAFAQNATQKVMVMDIKSEIDPRTNRFVELALENARKIEADIIIIEMDTYGGVLTDAKEIVDKIMDWEKPIWVYINSDAASAGALISIACDSIYMAPGASIGAATVVDATGERAPDKYQSYMRGIMRSTAEQNGRNPSIAEGMVDESIVIDSIKKEGQVITFSTSEAIKYGYCEAKVNSIEEILELNKVKTYTIEKFELSAVDKIVSIFLNPFISGILILVIIAGIYFEMQTPGIGFPLLAAGVALVLYLVPYYLNGLAENWEIITLFIGFALIAVEIFVLPGFGIAGIAGITLTVGSLILIMVNNDAFDFEFVASENLIYAAAAAFAGLFGGIVLLFVGGGKLMQSKRFQAIALTETMDKEKGFVATFFPEKMTGKQGKAITVLRPAGKIEIEGKVYDAYSRGEYIEKDTEIEVIGEDTTSLQVKQRPA